MSLNKEFFNRETNITAKVIADSINENGSRITTLEVEYPRFIHGEVMTHRALSKNSSSSRAIPIQRMLDQIESNMAIPVYWGKNQSGMQASEEVSQLQKNLAVDQWGFAYSDIKHVIDRMIDLGLHKQVPNRLSEPFQMMKVVITGTDWNNFFNLRIHKDAQPEICMLAYKIYKAMEDSKPVVIKGGEWHLPYVSVGWNGKGDIAYFDEGFNVITLEDAIKISASCCAQVSYRNTDMSLEKADKIFDMLIKADVLHASCFEHLATPIPYANANSSQINYEMGMDQLIANKKGITHINSRGDYCSGNLTGFVSYRQILPDNTNWKFNFEDRMNMFK